LVNGVCPGCGYTEEPIEIKKELRQTSEKPSEPSKRTGEGAPSIPPIDPQEPLPFFRDHHRH
jgi:hypothetical protein